MTYLTTTKKNRKYILKQIRISHRFTIRRGVNNKGCCVEKRPKKD